MTLSEDNQDYRKFLERQGRCDNASYIDGKYTRGYQGVRIVDASELRRKTDEEIKISVLTDANKKLHEEYSALIKKTTIILEAYKKLEIENEALKSKLGKRESVTKTVENSKNYLKNIYDNFINWINS